MENRTITIELRDETAKIIGGILAIGLGTCHFSPRGVPRPDTLLLPYRDGVRVSAILKLIPADFCVVFDGEDRYGRANMRSWGDEFPDPIIGYPFSGMGAWLVPVVDGEPVRYGASLAAAVGKECAFLVRRHERIRGVA